MFQIAKRTILIAATASAALGLAHAAWAATEERLSKPELLKLNECMAMKPDMLARDGQCDVVMKKASLTASDLEKMRRCESKMNVDVTKDQDCAAMIKKHPELVRGHGQLQPEPSGTKPPSN